MLLRIKGSYQGVQCKRVKYRRSDGLRPEPGYVDIALEKIKKIKVDYQSVPWTGVNDDFEFPGQISISAWSQILYPSIVTKPTKQPDAPDVGLNHWGTLEMQSFDDKGKALSEPMLYNFIYVDSSGIEEVGPQIAAIRKHDRGTVRVPLTDIRRYYEKFGLFVTRINVKDESGKWDVSSLRFDFGEPEPWKLDQVIKYFFSQLPGSPFPFYDDDVKEDKDLLESTPTNLIGRGEPVRGHLEKLLDDQGLVPKMLPSGNYVLSRKGSKIVPEGKIPVDLGSYDFYPDEHYETASAYCTDRSPLFVVIGRPVVRRITIPYIPVLEDVDGLIFPLSYVEELWGYSLAKLNKQVFATSDRSFENCPPIGAEAQQQPGLHQRRVEILKRMAYKAYAPATVFSNALTAFSDASAVPAVSRAMMERQPFLPLVDAAWYQREIKNLDVEIPLEIKSGADQEPYAILPPIVRAKRVGNGWFQDIEAVERAFEQAIKPRLDVDKEFPALIAYLKEINEFFSKDAEIRTVDEGITVEKVVSSGESAVAAAEKFIATLSRVRNDRIKNLEVDVQGDFDAAISKFRGVLTKQKLMEIAFNKTWESSQVKAALEKSASELAEMFKKSQDATELIQQSMEIFRRRYAEYNGHQLNMNLPWRVIPGGEGMIDKKTGLLQSTEPLCHAKRPFWFNGEGIEVAADGAVVVTAGFEKYDTATGGLTLVLFRSTGPDDAPKLQYNGMNRPSALKGEGVQAPKLRLYQDDLGQPINGGAVISDAASKVIGAAKQPVSADGMAYQFNGLVRAVLEGGCNSVQHVYDADKPGETLTWVAMNAPGCRGPLGPVMIPRGVSKADIQEHLESGSSDRLRNLG